jgi:hypothetical protein
MPSTVSKALQRFQGILWGDQVRDSALYFDGHTLVVDAVGRDTAVAALQVRGLSPSNAPTELFRVDKDGKATVGGNAEVVGNTTLDGLLTVLGNTAIGGSIALNGGLTVGAGQVLNLAGAVIAGQPTWNSAQSITLGTAAQPNVTSLGTLTSLAVSGQLTLSATGAVLVTASAGTAAIYAQLENTGGHAFFGLDSSAGGITGTNYATFVRNDSATPIIVQVNTAEVARFTSGGILCVNDSSNASMTRGITVNQGAADDEILALKSSDVAHGITNVSETDTFAAFYKSEGTNGGLKIEALNGGTAIALNLLATAGADNTTKSTAGLAAVLLQGYKKSGAGQGGLGADANVVAIQNNGITRFIFDVEGSGHADVEWATYDTHDDLALITTVEHELLGYESPDQTARRKHLEAVGIIGKDSWHVENGRPRAMVNFTRLAMLHHGALMQVAERFKAVEDQVAERFAALEARLALAGT